MMIFIVPIRDLEPIAFFETKKTCINKCKCNRELSTIHAVNPAFYKKYETRTDFVTQINSDLPIEVSNYVFEFAKNAKNNNQRDIRMLYCSKCRRLYNNAFMIKKKMCGYTYYWHRDYEPLSMS